MKLQVVKRRSNKRISPSLRNRYMIIRITKSFTTRKRRRRRKTLTWLGFKEKGRKHLRMRSC